MPELGSPGRNWRGEDIPAAVRSPAEHRHPGAETRGRTASLPTGGTQGVTGPAGHHRQAPGVPCEATPVGRRLLCLLSPRGPR